MQVQRRLTNGLQMGMAYTLAKGEGYTGYDPYTDEIGGEAAIRARYWGPTTTTGGTTCPPTRATTSRRSPTCRSSSSS